MRKYLVVLQEDVCDEGYVGAIYLLNQEELDRATSIRTGFGNIEGEIIPFDKSQAMEITDDEIKVLEKFNLIDLQFGECYFVDEEDYDEE